MFESPLSKAQSTASVGKTPYASAAAPEPVETPGGHAWGARRKRERARPGGPEEGAAVRYLRLPWGEPNRRAAFRSHAARHEATQPRARSPSSEEPSRRPAGRGAAAYPAAVAFPVALPHLAARQSRAGPARRRAAGEAGDRSEVVGAAAGSERRFVNGAIPISIVSAFYYYI